jgi:hypothetical protein
MDVGGSFPPVILTDAGEMVLIDAGEVALGSAHVQQGELRYQTAHLPAFYMDRYEVSNQYYLKFCRVIGRDLPGQPPSDPQHLERREDPVLNVSWADAHAFAEWAGKWLPSELEWKLAASSSRRATDFRIFETARTGRRLTWVDGNFLDPLGEASPVIRTDGKIPGFVPLSDLNGPEDVSFRCASSVEILKTIHYLGRALSPAQTR